MPDYKLTWFASIVQYCTILCSFSLSLSPHSPPQRYLSPPSSHVSCGTTQTSSNVSCAQLRPLQMSLVEPIQLRPLHMSLPQTRCRLCPYRRSIRSHLNWQTARKQIKFHTNVYCARIHSESNLFRMCVKQLFCVKKWGMTNFAM